MLQHFAKCWQNIVDETIFRYISEKCWKKKKMLIKKMLVPKVCKSLTKNY
jgi:hypothetical protein